MKKLLLLVTVCFSAFLLTQCTQKAAPSASATPVDEAAELRKKYTPAQVAQGKNVFENRCSSCHELRQPAELTVKLWDKILPKMCRKAELTLEEAGIVRAYVITNAKAG